MCVNFHPYFELQLLVHALVGLCGASYLSAFQVHFCKVYANSYSRSLPFLCVLFFIAYHIKSHCPDDLCRNHNYGSCTLLL